MAIKPIRISRHARFEMKRRGIIRIQVVQMIRAPGQVLPSSHGRKVYQDEGCWVADVPDLMFCSAFGDTAEESVHEVQRATEADP